MLDGVTPFPAEFAARYRALGYWEDRPLFDGFKLPERLEVFDSLPLSGFGKVSKKDLAARLAGL